MSRAPLAALVGLLGVFALGPFPSRAEDTAGIAWNDSKHPEFFRYQTYLKSKGLKGLEEPDWGIIASNDQHKRLEEDEGYLKQWFESHMAAANKMTPEDREMLHAVWGQAISDKMETLRKAEALKDPRQVMEASKAVAGLASIAGMPVELQNAAFTGAKPAAPVQPVNYLEVKAKEPFVRSLKDEKIAAVLKDQESFNTYIQAKVKSEQIAEVAQPGLEAMYQVIGKADGEEKKEMSHILPTVVRFLEDGKKIQLDTTQAPGVYGVAYRGDYETADRVGVTPALKNADPIFVADTLAHEFQHVYDHSTGRKGTLDTELRGFKVNVMFGRTLKKAAPAKYAELREGDDDQARQLIRASESDDREYTKSPDAFADAIAWGHGYAAWGEGHHSGNMSLVQSLDPENGLIRELNAKRRFAAAAKEHVAEAEKGLAAAKAAAKAAPDSRTARTTLEKATEELDSARRGVLNRTLEADRLEIGLRGMQKELAWLRKKDPKAKYDLILQVDEELTKP